MPVTNRYIVEVISGETVEYLYTRRVLLRCQDLAKKFMHRKSAVHFFETSEFCTEAYQMRILTVPCPPRRRRI